MKNLKMEEKKGNTEPAQWFRQSKESGGAVSVACCAGSESAALIYFCVLCPLESISDRTQHHHFHYKRRRRRLWGRLFSLSLSHSLKSTWIVCSLERQFHRIIPFFLSPPPSPFDSNLQEVVVGPTKGKNWKNNMMSTLKRLAHTKRWD